METVIGPNFNKVNKELTKKFIDINHQNRTAKDEIIKPQYKVNKLRK